MYPLTINSFCNTVILRRFYFIILAFEYLMLFAYYTYQTVFFSIRIRISFKLWLVPVLLLTALYAITASFKLSYFLMPSSLCLILFDMIVSYFKTLINVYWNFLIVMQCSTRLGFVIISNYSKPSLLFRIIQNL